MGTINGRINALAYEASVIYWLTGEEKYAKFAADILNQWVSGVVYQEPIDGPGRTGFLDIQTLGDEKEKPLILAYDFLYPYLVKYKYPWKIMTKLLKRSLGRCCLGDIQGITGLPLKVRLWSQQRYH